MSIANGDISFWQASVPGQFHEMDKATVPTPVLAAFQRRGNSREAARAHPSVSPEDAARNLLGVMETLTPEHTGGFYDWKGETVSW